MSRNALAWAAAAFLFAGCNPVIKRTLPDSVHALAVKPFQNLSDQALLPSLLDEEIRRAFRLDGRVAIAEQAHDADALLDGTIAVYLKEPIRYDANNIVQEYQLRIGVDLVLTDPAGLTTLWVEPTLSATATGKAARAAKPVQHRLIRTEAFTVVPASGLPVETEADAQRRAARDLAQDVVRKVIEGW